MSIFSKTIAVFFASVLVLAVPISVHARDGNFQQKYGHFSDPHVRYPGDSNIREGNIRTDGPDQGAYIERCNWSLNSDFGKGFGLTQRCRRYTIKNTE